MWKHLGEYFISFGIWGYLALLLSILSGVNAYSNITGNPIPIFSIVPTWGWLTLLVLGLLFMPFFAFHKVKSKLDVYENAQPNIVFDEPYVWSGRMVILPRPPASDQEHILDIADAKIKPNYHVLRAKVKNAPDNPLQDAEAGQAVLKIDFMPKDESTPVLEIDGRWSDNPQAPTRGLQTPIADLRKRDLLPNNDYHEIDIAVKVHEDSDWFATNDYAQREASDGKYPGYILPTDCLDVRITITAINLKEPAIGWVRIENHGGNTVPTIELLMR